MSAACLLTRLRTQVQGCSALRKEGIKEGFQWLADKVTESKRKK